MNRREIIIERIRKKLGRQSVDTKLIAKEIDELSGEIEDARPALELGSVSDIFISRATAEKVGSTTERIKSLDELPVAVRNYLVRQGLGLQTALQPEPSLQALNWAPVFVTAHFSADCQVCVQKALWAIAETGTLIFHSSATSPTLMSYLPLHDIVVIEACKILRYLEDYVEVTDEVPRNVNLITGPSGTTDIEGTLVHGAHGPGFLHIVIVEN